jgi:hypothetical protein
MAWYILHEAGVTGPIEHSEMDSRLSRGEIGRDTFVGRGVEGPWGKASVVFPLAFGIISVTAVPPAFATEEARRLLAPAVTEGRSVKSAPVPIGVSPAASSLGEMGIRDSFRADIQTELASSRQTTGGKPKHVATIALIVLAVLAILYFVVTSMR